MSFQNLTVLGTMSGTSLDGIDLSLVKTNGKILKRCNIQKLIKFESNFKKKLHEFIKTFSLLNTSTSDINEINNLITAEYINSIEKTNIIQKCDLIGFHGQTIFHSSKIKKTIQLGDAIEISNYFRKPIVYNFREDDIKNGGQGAPIAPIYHKYLIESNKLKLPSCILNIGGISNLSYWDSKNLIGFDTGPGNILMDQFMKESFNKDFDYNGKVSSKGSTNKEILKTVLINNFFLKKFPKSLDSQAFKKEYNYIINNIDNQFDIMSTLLDFTILSIKKGIDLLPKKINSIMITGGGSFNKELSKRLAKMIKIKITENIWDLNNNNFLEADMIGYLAARKINNLPSTFYDTTGTKKPTILGSIYPTIKNL